MTFEIATPVIPTSIGFIQITLFEKYELQADGSMGWTRCVNYEVEVLDADGSRMRVHGDCGDLIPHLTSDQIEGLLQFMADMRVKATAEFIG